MHNVLPKIVKVKSSQNLGAEPQLMVGFRTTYFVTFVSRYEEVTVFGLRLDKDFIKACTMPLYLSDCFRSVVCSPIVGKESLPAVRVNCANKVNLHIMFHSVDFGVIDPGKF
jgi:hypothetical protein